MQRLPFRTLRGKVTCFYSTRVAIPKMHLIEDCPGLEKTSADAIGVHTFSDVVAMALDTESRPCRMCALASVLKTVGSATFRPDERRVLVTCTSQPAPDRVDGNPFRFDYRAATGSGQERLVKLARQLRWQTLASPVGVVATMAMTQTAADVLGRNLRTAVLDDAPVGPVPAARVEVFWTLASDTPPEIDETSVTELWRTASLLSS